jgi:hypothetical protein
LRSKERRIGERLRTIWAKRRQRILQAAGVTAHPEMLVQLRNEIVADAEGFNVHRRQHKSIRNGEDGKVRRSPQAVACRKRYDRELGKPREFLKAEKAYREAKEYCERESLPNTFGVSYQA